MLIARFSVIHCTKLPLNIIITSTEKALNVQRKNAQGLTPMMMPKNIAISKYRDISKKSISFWTIRYIDIENDISIGLCRVITNDDDDEDDDDGESERLTLRRLPWRSPPCGG